MSLTTFWIHIVLYDNIRYVNTCTFWNLLYKFFLLVKIISINFAKLVKIFCIFQKLKYFPQKQIYFDNLTFF